MKCLSSYVCCYVGLYVANPSLCHMPRYSTRDHWFRPYVYYSLISEKAFSPDCPKQFWTEFSFYRFLYPMICGTIFGVTCTYLFSTDHVTMQPKSKILLDLIDSIAISPVKLMHLKVFGCYMHGTLKTWSVHPPQPKPELETRVRTRSHIMEGQQGGHTTADGTFTGAKYKTSLLVTGLTVEHYTKISPRSSWVSED